MLDMMNSTTAIIVLAVFLVLVLVGLLVSVRVMARRNR